MTEDLRKYTTLDAHGNKEEIFVDATWELVRGHRITMLRITDRLLGNQWDRLTEEQKEELKTLRQHWRDITKDHDTPNEACDAMLEIPLWVTLMLD